MECRLYIFNLRFKYIALFDYEPQKNSSLNHFSRVRNSPQLDTRDFKLEGTLQPSIQSISALSHLEIAKLIINFD